MATSKTSLIFIFLTFNFAIYFLFIGLAFHLKCIILIIILLKVFKTLAKNEFQERIILLIAFRQHQPISQQGQEKEEEVRRNQEKKMYLLFISINS